MSSSLDPIFDTAFAHRQDAAEALREAAQRRILVLDGAMGTQIQALGFTENHFRGERFLTCECHLQGNNDLLTLTQPQAIEDIHFAYAMAGRGHPGNQHLFVDHDRPGRLRHAGGGLRPQPRRRAPRPARRDQGGAVRTAGAASSPARSGRPTERRPCRPTSTIPATAPSPSTTSGSPTASRSAA